MRIKCGIVICFAVLTDLIPTSNRGITLRYTKVYFVALHAVEKKRRNKNTHCTRNGRNGAVILIASAGRISAKSMVPVETVLHVRILVIFVVMFVLGMSSLKKSEEHLQLRL